MQCTIFRISQRISILDLSKNISQCSAKAIHVLHNNIEENKNVNQVAWDNAKPFEEIPGPKPLPLLGNTWRFLPIIGNFSGKPFAYAMADMNKKYGNILKLEKVFGIDDAVYLFDPKDFETIYRLEDHLPERTIFPSLTYFRDNYMQDIFGQSKGLLTSNGEEWYHFRNKVNSTMMQPRVVKQYISVVDEITQDFIKKLANNLDEKNQLKSDLSDETKKWTIESISYIATDTRLGALDSNNASSLGNELIATSEKVFDLAQKLDFKPSLWRIFPTKTFRDSMKANQDQVLLSQNVINNAIEKLNEGKNSGNSEHEPSVLEKLYKIDPKIAVVMATDMLLAGAETTSASFVNLVYQLATNKDKQEKLRKEILHFLPKQSDKLTIDMLNSMTYLKACIKESTRIYAIIPGVIRKMKKDIVLSGYRIPKGSNMFMMHMSISTKEGHFPHPNEYLPERWLRENIDTDYSFKRAHPFCMMPFGFGSRSCIGRRFADLELEIGTITLMRNFNISWDGPPPKKAIFGLNTYMSPYNFVYERI